MMLIFVKVIDVKNNTKQHLVVKKLKINQHLWADLQKKLQGCPVCAL